MDAKEHLYKVLVIGEYGVGESYAVSFPLSLKHDQPSLIAASFFFVGKVSNVIDFEVKHTSAFFSKSFFNIRNIKG